MTQEPKTLFTTFNNNLVMFINTGSDRVVAVGRDGALLSYDNIYNIAYEKSTSSEVLELLSKHFSVDVRRSVALNPSTPAEALNRLSKHFSVYVRRSVALNPSAPAEALNRLSKDEDVYVRRNAKNNFSSRKK